MAENSLSESLKAVPATADSPDNRMPAIAPEDQTEDQKAVSAEFEAQRGRAPGGPFTPLLRAPEVFRYANQMGQYLRFKTELPMTLSEFAILITARRWSQNYEWLAHRKIAEQAGLSPAIVEAVREGRHPEGMSDNEQTIYAFCTELHHNGQVSDASYERAKIAFGERGVIDIAAICGHYSTLAMIMNVAKTPGPVGEDLQLSGFNR